MGTRNVVSALGWGAGWRPSSGCLYIYICTLWVVFYPFPPVLPLGALCPRSDVGKTGPAYIHFCQLFMYVEKARPTFTFAETLCTSRRPGRVGLGWGAPWGVAPLLWLSCFDKRRRLGWGAPRGVGRPFSGCLVLTLCVVFYPFSPRTTAGGLRGRLRRLIELLC